jgi:hypothetical protein
MSANQRIHGRYLHDEHNSSTVRHVLGAALPTVPTDRSRPGTSYQVGHTYVISPTLINEAKVGAAWNGQRIKPQGDFWLRDTFGFAYPELFDTPGFVDGGIPTSRSPASPTSPVRRSRCSHRPPTSRCRTR